MPAKKFKLTPENYYSSSRPHISNSMIQTYVQSPNLYKLRYIDRDPEAQIEKTDNMKRGSIVDEMLTEGKTNYVVNPYSYNGQRKDYNAFKEENDPDWTVSEKTMNQAMEIAEAITRQPFWEQNKKGRGFQLILEGTLGDSLICGKPDWIDTLGKQRYRLVDLKVVGGAKVQSPKKWMHNALDMGYYRQLALYRYLFANLQGIPENYVQCYWAVAAYHEYGRVAIKLYKAQEDIMVAAMEQARQALAGIQSNIFEDPLLGWENVIDLSKLSD